MKIRAPRVPFVKVARNTEDRGGAMDDGTLSRDGLAFLNSLEDRIADLEALVQIALRPD